MYSRASQADERTRPVSRPVWGAIAVAIVALLFILFHWQGNTTDITSYSTSAFGWMLKLWRYEQYDFSHGWLIPLISLWLVWRRRAELATASRQPAATGLAIVVLALALHVIGARSQHTRLSLLAFIGLVWGIPFYLLGWQIARILLFPCLYLVFCVPFTFLDSLTFPLRMLAATISEHILNGTGVATVRVGTALRSGAGDGFLLDVADPCSGLKYFIVMTALTAAYGYVTQPTLLRKWVLFLSAVPLAIAGNVVRIVGIALVAAALGQPLAIGLYHDYSGLIVFAAAVLMMLGVATLLNMDISGKIRAWRTRTS